VDGDIASVPPTLRFCIRLQGQEHDDYNIFALFGELKLRARGGGDISLGNFHPNLEPFLVKPASQSDHVFYLDFDENKRHAVENERDAGDANFKIRLCYQYFKLETTPEGHERVRNIASTVLWTHTAEGSDTITIEQSRWNKVLSQLGYSKRLLLELPIDFEEILSSIPKHPQEGLIRRIQAASESFHKALNELKIGKCREAVLESRKVYEALSKKKLEDGKDVKEAIQELLLKYGLPKQNKDNITNIIENFWAYTSPTHHILDNEGNVITENEPTMFGREDAFLTVTTAGLLIKMLAEKLMSK
jgi:hypothetical protein